MEYLDLGYGHEEVNRCYMSAYYPPQNKWVGSEQGEMGKGGYLPPSTHSQDTADELVWGISQFVANVGQQLVTLPSDERWSRGGNMPQGCPGGARPLGMLQSTHCSLSGLCLTFL